MPSASIVSGFKAVHEKSSFLTPRLHDITNRDISREVSPLPVPTDYTEKLRQKDDEIAELKRQLRDSIKELSGTKRKFAACKKELSCTQGELINLRSSETELRKKVDTAVKYIEASEEKRKVTEKMTQKVIENLEAKCLKIQRESCNRSGLVAAAQLLEKKDHELSMALLRIDVLREQHMLVREQHELELNALREHHELELEECTVELELQQESTAREVKEAVDAVLRNNDEILRNLVETEKVKLENEYYMVLSKLDAGLDPVVPRRRDTRNRNRQRALIDNPFEWRRYIDEYLAVPRMPSPLFREVV